MALDSKRYTRIHNKAGADLTKIQQVHDSGIMNLIIDHPEDDQVMTFGRRFGSTSDQRLKVLGENVVGFELSAKNNGPNQEWQYDDVIVEASLG